MKLPKPCFASGMCRSIITGLFMVTHTLAIIRSLMTTVSTLWILDRSGYSGRNLSPGPCWLGRRGTIYGHCFLGSPIVIDSIEAWRGLRHRHRVEVDELPYKTTYGFPVHQCRRVTLTSYEHPRGAVGIVRFHRASSRHKGQRPPSGGA